MPGVERVEINLKIGDRATLWCTPKTRLALEDVKRVLEPFGATVQMCYRENDIRALTAQLAHSAANYEGRAAAPKHNEHVHRIAIHEGLAALAALRDAMRAPGDATYASDPRMLTMFDRLDAHIRMTNARGVTLPRFASLAEALAHARRSADALTKTTRLLYHVAPHERLTTFLHRAMFAHYCDVLESVAADARKIVRATERNPKRTAAHARFGRLASVATELAAVLGTTR